MNNNNNKKPDNLDFIKIKNVCSVKDTDKRMERHPTDETFLQSTYLTKDFVSRIYEELSKFNKKKQI